jgi:antitoxin component HigA of HigAB toxin-antitoxin module
MSDGRGFSDYKACNLSDKKIKENANIKNNFQYRQYLQNNADTIIKNNQENACFECSTCNYLNNTNTNVNTNVNTPYIFNYTISKDQPYGYENSDLKNLYLSKQKLNSVLNTPRIQINN